MALMIHTGGRRSIGPLVGLESIVTCHRLLWQLCIRVICVILLHLRLSLRLDMCLYLCLRMCLSLCLLLLSKSHGRQMDLLLPSLLFLLLQLNL